MAMSHAPVAPPNVWAEQGLVRSLRAFVFKTYVVAEFEIRKLRRDPTELITRAVRRVVFAGLAAYDAQRLGAMADAMPVGRVGAYAISGALALYLDFVNLFLSLVRLGGRRRD